MAVPIILINNEKLDAIDFAEMQAAPTVVRCPRQLHPHYAQAKQLEVLQVARKRDIAQAVLIDASLTCVAHLISLALSDHADTTSQISFQDRLISSSLNLLFTLVKALLATFFLRNATSHTLKPFEYATISVQLHTVAIYALVLNSNGYLDTLWPGMRESPTFLLGVTVSALVCAVVLSIMIVRCERRKEVGGSIMLV